MSVVSTFADTILSVIVWGIFLGKIPVQLLNITWARLRCVCDGILYNTACFRSLRLTFALTDVRTFLKLFCISLLLFYSRFVGVWSSFGSLPQPFWILFSGSLFWILAWEPCNYYFWSICSWAISLRINGEYVFKVLKEDKINCMVWSGSHVLVLPCCRLGWSWCIWA